MEIAAEIYRARRAVERVVGALHVAVDVQGAPSVVEGHHVEAADEVAVFGIQLVAAVRCYLTLSDVIRPLGHVERGVEGIDEVYVAVVAEGYVSQSEAVAPDAEHRPVAAVVALVVTVVAGNNYVIRVVGEACDVQVIAVDIHAVGFGCGGRVGIMYPINIGSDVDFHGVGLSAVHKVCHGLLEGIVYIVVALYLLVGQSAVDIDGLFAEVYGLLLAFETVGHLHTVLGQRDGILQLGGVGALDRVLCVQAYVCRHLRREVIFYRSCAVGVPPVEIVARLFGDPIEGAFALLYRLRPEHFAFVVVGNRVPVLLFGLLRLFKFCIQAHI